MIGNILLKTFNLSIKVFIEKLQDFVSKGK